MLLHGRWKAERVEYVCVGVTLTMSWEEANCRGCSPFTSKFPEMRRAMGMPVHRELRHQNKTNMSRTCSCSKFLSNPFLFPT